MALAYKPYKWLPILAPARTKSQYFPRYRHSYNPYKPIARGGGCGSGCPAPAGAQRWRRSSRAARRAGPGAAPAPGLNRGLRRLRGLARLTEIGERSRVDRRLGHARGREALTKLLAALWVIEATRGAGMLSGGRQLGRLTGRFGERRLVLTLELLDGGQRETWVGSRPLRSRTSWPIRSTARSKIVGVAVAWSGSPPAAGLLPHVRDLLRSGRLPPRVVEHGPEAFGSEQPLGIDPGLGGPCRLFALAP